MVDRDAKKQIPLRLSKTLWLEINRWADEEFRSVNGQIEYILTEAVRRRRRGSATEQTPEQAPEQAYEPTPEH